MRRVKPSAYAYTPSAYTYTHGETKEIVNGHVVKDQEINSEYNGKILHIDERNNNKFNHFTIDNKHLRQLLSKTTNNINLIDRLKTDFSIKKHNKKTRKYKKHGKKHEKKHGKKYKTGKKH